MLHFGHVNFVVCSAQLISSFVLSDIRFFSGAVLVLLNLGSTFSESCSSNSEVTPVNIEELVMYVGHKLVIFLGFIRLVVPIFVNSLAMIVLYGSFAVAVNVKSENDVIPSSTCGLD